MITVDEALATILGQVSELAPISSTLVAATGCVLKEDIVARESLPPFDNSAMDGYALRAEDVQGASEADPVELQVLEDLPAGHVAKATIHAGQAIRIMTGAPMPDGGDSVVMVERTERTERADGTGPSEQSAGAGGDGPKGGVLIKYAPRLGDNVRMAGEDVKAGSVVLKTGKRLNAGSIGMLASLGFPQVRVVPRPVVGIVSTGDELVDVGEELTPGKIRNSNAYSLAALVIEAGAIPRIIGIAKDTVEEVTAAIREGLNCDAVVTSGGVSVGDYDLVKAILDELGQMIFWKVAMKPAKPLAFGLIDGTPLFGLPGNPTSSMVSFEQFVRPALLKMAGQRRLSRQIVKATVAETQKKRAGMRYFVRVTLERAPDGSLIAHSSGHQSSGALTAMTKAHGLMVLPDGLEEVAAGSVVDVQVFYPEDCL